MIQGQTNIPTDPQRTLKRLRLARGLSPEALAHEILQRANGGRSEFTVTADTIRRLERDGRPAPAPTARVAKALADFFELHPWDIWPEMLRPEVDG